MAGISQAATSSSTRPNSVQNDNPDTDNMDDGYGSDEADVDVTNSPGPVGDMSAVSRSKKGNGALIINDEEVRIVMVGKTGAGKSATAKTILDSKAFESKRSPKSVTENCQKVKGVVDGRNISVIDTPGFFDTRFSKDEVINEVQQCIRFAAPGPHALLHVIILDRFTEEDKRAMDLIQNVFGQKSAEYTKFCSIIIPIIIGALIGGVPGALLGALKGAVVGGTVGVAMVCVKEKEKKHLQ